MSLQAVSKLSCFAFHVWVGTQQAANVWCCTFNLFGPWEALHMVDCIFRDWPSARNAVDFGMWFVRVVRIGPFQQCYICTDPENVCTPHMLTLKHYVMMGQQQYQQYCLCRKQQSVNTLVLCHVSCLQERTQLSSLMSAVSLWPCLPTCHQRDGPCSGDTITAA